MIAKELKKLEIGNHQYKLILLDTNAIREIVTNTNFSGKGFFVKFFMNEDLYAPCFSIYNVIELMPYEDIFKQFIDFFSKIPCIMIYSAKSIIYEEYNQYVNDQQFIISNEIANAFTPAIDNESYNLRKFIEKMMLDIQLMQIIKNDIIEQPSVVISWEQQRIDAKKLLQKMKLPTNMIDDRYYRSQETVTIFKDLKNWGISPKDDVDINALPSLRIMEYSQFNRIHMTNKKVYPNDVMDVTISCIIPYMDAVITENFQANVYKKAKRFIKQLNNLEIYTLKDIRAGE